jgi:hypothetical protein
MATSAVTADNLRDIADRIVAALNNNTAAQLAVAIMVERQNRDNTSNETPDYIRETVMRAFFAMQDTSQR